MDRLQFTIPEMLSLMGVVQCIYILVYMGLRAGDVRRACLPFIYFLILGGAFFLDFAARFIAEISPYYYIMGWLLWFSGPPVSFLLMIQIARIRDVPGWRNFWVLFLPPAAFLASWIVVRALDECRSMIACDMFDEWLVIFGLAAGLCSMAAIWFQRAAFRALADGKAAPDRYWLILMLIMLNLSFLAVMLISLAPGMRYEDTVLIRTILGLGFVYLTGTSLFRIYPQALQIKGAALPMAPPAQGDDSLAARIEALLNLDKVYQEPNYGRSQIAQELGVPEAAISRVINQHFGKNLPQILNERRIEDAKRLLGETDAPINVIAREVGFNSLASFNRVFRDMTGMTPGGWRTSSKHTS